MTVPEIEEKFHDERVTYTLQVGERFFVVENVPARVSDRTGERLFAPATASVPVKMSGPPFARRWRPAAGTSASGDGTHVSAETSRRMACDAARVAMRHAAEGSVLAVGRRTRAISPGLMHEGGSSMELAPGGEGAA